MHVGFRDAHCSRHVWHIWLPQHGMVLVAAASLQMGHSSKAFAGKTLMMTASIIMTTVPCA